MDVDSHVAPLPAKEGRATRWALAGVAAAALVALFYPRAGETPAQPGGFLVDGEGRAVPVLAELGAPTLVHFWATWCPPCRTELPELVRFAREREGAGPRVLFVAVGDDPAAARRFLAANEQRLLFDPAWEVTHRFGTDKLPETHLVVDGRIVQSFVGATPWGEARIAREVRKWTATPTSAVP